MVRIELHFLHGIIKSRTVKFYASALKYIDGMRRYKIIKLAIEHNGERIEFLNDDTTNAFTKAVNYIRRLVIDEIK